jgi:hypothetical protein
MTGKQWVDLVANGLEIPNGFLDREEFL